MAITLRLITENDLEMIMNWRMSESVTRFMNTNPKLTIEGQKKWFDSLKTDDKSRNWIIEVDGMPAGLINLIDIDWKNGNTSWGYYIGEEKLRSLKLAISLEMSLYDYCFDVLGFEEVHNEVFKLNEGVWKLHLACGDRIVKEVAGEVVKDGVAYDIVHLSIERDEWLKLRVNKKYEKISFDKFGDPIGGMTVHHLGMAVSDIDKSIASFKGLGWILDGEIVDDKLRNVKLAFLKRCESDEIIELVSPTDEKSPVTNTLKAMKNVPTPYHICYKVRDLDKTIEILKGRGFILTDPSKPAVAFEDRRVAFLLSRDSGLLELLEEEKSE